jgi:hypothetical protein
VSGHEGHVPGAYSLLCRACRIGADIERIREIGEPRNLEPMDLREARAFISRFPWTEGQAEAMRRAVRAGMTLAKFVGFVEEARREVTAGR